MKVILYRINSIILKVLKSALIILFASLILLMVVNVFLRYVLSKPLFWVTEICSYVLLYLIMGGATLALYYGNHISINIDLSKLGAIAKRIIDIISTIAAYILIIAFIIYGSILVCENISSYTGTVPISMGLVYLAVPVNAVIMLLLYSEKVIKRK